MAHRYIVYLIRHLPTKGNKERRYIGWTDEPILALDECLLPVQMTAKTVYGSDLLRARQSAALYFPQSAFEADTRWRECNFGDFEGKTYADLEEDEDYRRWIDNPYEHAPRSGESLAEVENRVMSAFRQLPNKAVVVTHGGPIRLILTHCSPLKKEFWSWSIPHGSGYRLEWESEEAFEEGKRCTSLSAVPIMAKGNT